MKILTLVGLLVAVLGWNVGEARKHFHALDVDGDGVISLKDVFKYFKQHDTDDDGALTFSEHLISSGRNPPNITVQGAFAVSDEMDGMVDNLINKSVAYPYLNILDPDNDGEVSLTDY